MQATGLVRGWVVAGGAGLLVLLSVTGCHKAPSQELEGSAPPPAPSAVPGVCKGGGGAIDDALAAQYFSRSVSSYCIDPNGPVRSYGKNAKGTIDEVCTEQFDGECEVYKRFGLERVVTLRYVDGAGTPGSIAVALSTFDSEAGAFGFYHKRVIAGSDPVKLRLETIEAEGQAVVGSTVAYVWKGSHVVELSYSNPEEAPEALRASAKRILPSVVAAFKLPGGATPPGATQFLPSDSRIPLGIEYVHGDVLGVLGAGDGAIGYYAKDGRRWRVLVVQRRDADSATDVTATFKKASGYAKLPDAPEGFFAFSARSDESSPRIDWILARRGATLVGVGDEEFAVSAAASAKDRADVSLDSAAKLALLQLILSTATAAPVP